MKRLLGTLPVLVLLLTLCPAWGVELPVQAEAALLMEKETGQVLYAKNEHQALEPASVTKVMTLLLVMEAIDRGTLAYDDVVTVSDYAASMGGSQIFLSPGEQITVEDLLKGVCVSSGNDAAVALAEKTAGVTELFVEQMNNRARVKTQLRRYTRYNPREGTVQEVTEYDFRGLQISKATHKCVLFGEELALTPLEFSILWYLCEHRGNVVSSEELFEHVWGEAFMDSNNTVMSHIARLREKMHEPSRKPKFIKTVWGVGYTIE